jgi:hypothetical protein
VFHWLSLSIITIPVTIRVYWHQPLDALMLSTKYSVSKIMSLFAIYKQRKPVVIVHLIHHLGALLTGMFQLRWYTSECHNGLIGTTQRLAGVLKGLLPMITHMRHSIKVSLGQGTRLTHMRHSIGVSSDSHRSFVRVSSEFRWNLLGVSLESPRSLGGVSSDT